MFSLFRPSRPYRTRRPSRKSLRNFSRKQSRIKRMLFDASPYAYLDYTLTEKKLRTSNGNKKMFERHLKNMYNALKGIRQSQIKY